MLNNGWPYSMIITQSPLAHHFTLACFPIFAGHILSAKDAFVPPPDYIAIRECRGNFQEQPAKSKE